MHKIQKGFSSVKPVSQAGNNFSRSFHAPHRNPPLPCNHPQPFLHVSRSSRIFYHSIVSAVSSLFFFFSATSCSSSFLSISSPSSSAFFFRSATLARSLALRLSRVREYSRELLRHNEETNYGYDSRLFFLTSCVPTF